MELIGVKHNLKLIDSFSGAPRQNPYRSALIARELVIRKKKAVDVYSRIGI
jgi:hypothetical protein